MPEDIVLRREDDQVVVVTAPREALISLELLRSSDPGRLQVSGDLITLADQVVYRVAGWQTHPPALVCWLAEDRRRTDPGAPS